MVRNYTCVRANIFMFFCLVMNMCGCHHSSPDPNRPPPQPEEFKLPPSDDGRFSKPVQYPKSLLNSDILQSRMANKAKNGTKGVGLPKGGGN